ncbi:MAG: hypothetical protein AB1632_08380 [Nitrospirota bacterium]
MYGLTKKEVLTELRKIGYTTLSELKEHLREYEKYADSANTTDDRNTEDNTDDKKNIAWS